MAREIPLSSPPLYQVIPLQGGRWQVIQEGGAAMIYDDKDSAVTAAVELARSARPGAVRILGQGGAVESERVFGVRERDQGTT